MTKPSPKTEDTQPTTAGKPYVAPTMNDLGALRDVTLGASPGIGDSGGAGSFRCPGCP